MNRIFERLAFFILGGIFVIIGYLLSGADTEAVPQEGITEFDTIVCKKLIVHDGTPGNEKIYLGFGDEGESQLVLSTAFEDGRNTMIYLSASEAGPFLEMWGDTRESGIISLRCSDKDAIIQASTLDREKDIEDNIEEDIKEDRSGVIIEATAEKSTVVIEEKIVEAEPRQW